MSENTSASFDFRLGFVPELNPALTDPNGVRNYGGFPADPGHNDRKLEAPAVPSPEPVFPEPEVSVKTEGPPADNFDKFLMKVRQVDPLLLWGVLRPKVLSHVTLFDVLVDKTVLQSQQKQPSLANIRSDRLAILLDELKQLLVSVGHALDQCCDRVKVEVPAEISRETFVRVPDELSAFFGRDRSLKEGDDDVFSSEVKRIFANDESLKPFSVDESRVAADVKVEDLRDFDDADFNDIDFDLSGNENDNDNDNDNDEDFPEYFPGKRKKAKKERKPNKAPEEVKQCDKCHKVFPRRQNYYFHKNRGKCPGIPQPPKYYRIVESRYFCIHPDCGGGENLTRDVTPSYTSRSIFWRHLQEKHLSDADMVLQCEVCPEKFAYLDMLKYHMQCKHDKQFACKHCGKCMSTKSGLTKHERCHTGEKPFACDECAYRTSSRSSLARHKRCRHDAAQTGRKHVCELCGKAFFTPAGLKEHKFTHSDIKRFSCHVCGKQLKNDSCYRRHMVCVHGHKYTCDICGKDFSAVAGINLHKREVHGILF